MNTISAPVTLGDFTNPLIDYNPESVADASVGINRYLPVLQDLDSKQVYDQVYSAAVGPQTTYVPKPMLVETIGHDEADRIRRGLRKETVTHTVQQGETLSKIAADYGINVATLLTENKIDPKDVNRIKPGTELAIAPEKTSNSTEWLDKLHAEEIKAREEQDKLRKAKLAKGKNKIVSGARAADDGTGGGKFLKPINPTNPPYSCYNGYHWWAIDCPSDVGTAVRAAASGVVEIADPTGFNGGYGDTIVVNHGNGWETRYAHLSQINVSVGERVAAGEVIAKSGNTGRSTGPHLHFEIHKNGQRLNPVSYVGS